MPDETEVTQRVPPPAAPPPPPPAPPGFVLRDAWPWLALLGVIAVAGLLVWLFVLRDRNDKGPLVPAVVGLPQQRAVAELTGKGFNVKIVIAPAKRPRGIVISQIPGGGTRLDPGQTVTLHASNGHPVTTETTTTTTAATTTATTPQTTTASSTQTTPAATAPLPDVVGQDVASGAGQVEAAGFVAQTDPVNASGPPGSIVQEDPAAGSDAKVGSVVRLGVAVGSNRPAVQVPNVVGQKAASARAALLAKPLTIRTEYKKGPAKSVGVVLSQSPAAGGTAPAYTQVTIVVGS
jgi:eukaryotic-like serine/threonine-protein kinase